MTSSTLNRLAPTQVELEFSITSTELAAAEDRAYRKLAKDVRLPGFRKGKVPRKIFEQAYGGDAVTSQAVEDVIPEVYAKAVREHDLDPVDRPKVEVLEESDGRPSRLKATVEVRPTIELGTYKGITVPRPPGEVSDEDVERSLNALAKERATLVPVERAAAMGDVATIDYAGTVDGGVVFEGGSAAGQSVELSEGRFVPGFVAGIVGMNAGETRNVDVRFPDDYPSPAVAGKPAVFAITLHELKEYELPSIDDEFARALSSNQSVEELKADLRYRLEAVSNARIRRAVGNVIVEKLLSTHDFPLPPTMVESELEHLMEDAAAGAASQGTSFGDHLKQIGKTEQELRASLRSEAESRVKTTLLIEQIAKAEKVAATPSDVALEVEALARRYGQPPARIRKALGNNLLSLMEGIVRNKTLDLLIDSAHLVADQETPRPAS
ncbi:MAG TPA: trigger factor [Candidatus Cybelea sp.]|nr:trigger factor [Candidatus Cybelea sp.]